MNLAASFDDFLDQRVNLNPDRITTLTKRVETIEKFLCGENGLGDQVERIVPQGSFAQKTIIKPPEDADTFDADVLLQFELQDGLEPKDYVRAVAAVFAASDRYKDLADPGKRCVTIDYAGEFHIDVVPYVAGTDGGWITNAETNDWERTNPEGFNRWLAERDELTGGRLVEVIRLAKYLRACSDIEFAAPSVTLTLLLAEHVTQDSVNDGEYADLPTAFVSLMIALDAFLQDNETRPGLLDPTCGSQNFHDRWDIDDYATCRDAIHTLVGMIEDAQAAQADADELAKWQEIFGDKFRSLNDAGVASAGRSTEEFLDSKYGFPTDLDRGYTVSVEGCVRKAAHMNRFFLQRKKNQVERWREIDFSYTTNAPAGHEVYWKVKNTGAEAANLGALRGEISPGTPRGTKYETTKYRGQHWVEVFVVVNGVCVAVKKQQVTIV